MNKKGGLQTTARLAVLLFLLTAMSALGQNLDAPKNLEVQKENERFLGRWDAVTGASYYEVWVERFGRWSFNEKRLETVPFTSSFELSVEDERSRFKVRAVDADGKKSDFSNEVRAKKVLAEDTSPSNSGTTAASTKPKDEFDPKAPPPEPPTGLFALWIEQDVIKFVWRKVKGAKRYTVEELKDGKWVSVPRIEYPKVNNALIKNHPAPGPYKFRVRSVGKNGRASEPSRTTTAKR